MLRILSRIGSCTHDRKNGFFSAPDDFFADPLEPLGFLRPFFRAFVVGLVNKFFFFFYP